MKGFNIRFAPPTSARPVLLFLKAAIAAPMEHIVEEHPVSVDKAGPIVPNVCATRAAALPIEQPKYRLNSLPALTPDCTSRSL